MRNQRALGPKTPPEKILELLPLIPPDRWPDGWHNWPGTQAAFRHLALQKAYELNTTPPPTAARGRGIVTCGGGVKYFPSVYVLLCRLREVGCHLPVEVWHLGQEEIDPAMAHLLAELGARPIDAVAASMGIPWRILRGWELKPFSILYSAFQEVLFLDADNTPLRDPSFLFAEPSYQEHGALLWPDYTTWTLSRAVWDIFGLEQNDRSCQPLVAREQVADTYRTRIPPDYDPPLESGQLVVDKGKCWNALRMAGWYAEHSDYVFKFVHGDKECFRLGFKRMNQPYSLVPFFPDWLTHTEIQHDPAGQPLFLHRTQDKLRLDGQNTASAVPGEAHLFELVDELRQRWSGKPWQNGHPNPIEQEVISWLEGKTLSYRRVGHDDRTLEFLPGGVIGQGAAKLEKRWDIFEQQGSILLAVSSDRSLTLLASMGPESFRGRWLRFEGMEVEMAIAQPGPTEPVPDAPVTEQADAEDTPAVAEEPTPAAPVPVPKPAIKLGIIMPVVLQVESLWEMTQKSVGLIKTSHDARLYVICNRLRNIPGLDAGSLHARLEELSGMPVQITVGDRSVAASWNEGLRQAISHGCNRFLIMANDCFLEPETIDRLVAAEEWLPEHCLLWSGTSQDKGAALGDFIAGCDFTAFMMKPATLAKVGWFDETFKPAYFEDNDYYARVILSGHQACKVRHGEFLHYGSATVRADAEMAHHKDHWWEHNRSYFHQKWGAGDPAPDDNAIRAHYHAHPFADPSKPLWWWEGCPTPLLESVSR